MNKNVNGFGGNGFFGDFEIDPLVKRGFQRLTDDFNQELLKKLLEKPLDEDLLAVYELIAFFELAEMDKRYLDLYETEISTYRSYVRLKYPHCGFCKKKQEQIALDASKCWLTRVDAVVATTIDAIILANRIKADIFEVVSRTPHLKNHLVKMFDRLATWDVSGSTVDAFFEQLSREIDLVDNTPLSELFRSCLRDLGPRLERRFLLYEGCEGFSERKCKCVLCVYNFRDTPEPFTKDACHVCCSIFRKRFFTTLVEFINLLQRD